MPKKSKPAENFASLAAVAVHAGVSVTALANWREQNPGFPSRGPHGYPRNAIDRWLRKHNLGPYRQAASPEGKISLTEARRLWTEEKTRTERSRANQAEIEEQIQLGSILLAGDVLRFEQQRVGIVVAVIGGFVEQLDRTLPESLDAELRQRIVDLAKKLHQQIFKSLEDSFTDHDTEEPTDGKTDHAGAIASGRDGSDAKADGTS